MKGRADYLELGDFNAVCFECGRKRKASTMKKHWQGYWLCPEHWEARQPQDFVRSMPDHQTPPWVQPPSDTFIQHCTFDGISAVAGLAIAGCAVVGYISPMKSLFFPNTANAIAGIAITGLAVTGTKKALLPEGL